jgi:hypothetical protein
MTVHEQPVGATVEWYTPPELFERLGLTFDLDVAAPVGGVSWVPAAWYFTPENNGLLQPWTGRVWMNPPYGPNCHLWVARFIAHGNGMALTASRTETRWWQSLAGASTSMCFLRDRLHFIRPDGRQSRASFGSTLFAIGHDCAVALLAANLGWTV